MMYSKLRKPHYSGPVIIVYDVKEEYVGSIRQRKELHLGQESFSLSSAHEFHALPQK
jgi:hypothetical protein